MIQDCGKTIKTDGVNILRAIIVEDETVIRNGLVRHVPWEQLEINELKAAANAEEEM